MGTDFSELIRKRVLVSDGATGTNLQAVGLKAGMHPESWVLESPDKILSLEKEFIQAGADLILTCTFGGTRLRLKDTPYAGRAGEVNRAAAELARRAVEGSQVLVGGSIGPTGLLLKPYGPLTADEAGMAFAEQAAGLAAGGVDLFVIETMFSLEEAELALQAVRAASDKPVVVSFSYDRGTRTMMGVKPEQVAAKFTSPGITALGANCGTTLENMALILQAYAESAPGTPLWAKPNAGVPRAGEDGSAVYDLTPPEMAAFATRFIGIGARIVGGCCGTSPAHLAAVASAAHQAS